MCWRGFDFSLLIGMYHGEGRSGDLCRQRCRVRWAAANDVPLADTRPSAALRTIRGVRPNAALRPFAGGSGTRDINILLLSCLAPVNPTPNILPTAYLPATCCQLATCRLAPARSPAIRERHRHVRAGLREMTKTQALMAIG
jgi:hypothetical protein